MQKISILGCGWFGLPLAEALVGLGWFVKGSTTSADKIAILKEAGIDPFLVRVAADGVKGEITSLLEGCDCLIIDFPPKLRNNASESFVSKIECLIPYIERSGVRRVIFVSSISVYGENQLRVTEDSVAVPDGEAGRQLLLSEQMLMKNESFSTTVVRFGGLVGSDRHPVFHLSGRVGLERPAAPINLIHLSDCIGIVLAILENKSENEIFNAVAPFHPERREYYLAKARQMHLDEPGFIDGDDGLGKVVSSDKIEETLGYQFLVTNEI